MSDAGGAGVPSGAAPRQRIEEIAQEIIAKDVAQHPMGGRPGKLPAPRRPRISKRLAIAATIALLIGAMGGVLIWNNGRGSDSATTDPVSRLTSAANLSSAPRVITGTGDGQRVHLDRTFVWGGWTISVGDLSIERDTNTSQYSVVADATFTNNGRFQGDTGPTRSPLVDVIHIDWAGFSLKADGRDFGQVRIDGVDTPYGTTSHGTFRWNAGSTGSPPPDLSHAVFTVGTPGVVQDVLATDGKGFSPLAPKSLAVSGVADTGPDTISVTFSEGQLRADFEDTEAHAGKLILVIPYTLVRGKHYSQGGSEVFDTKDLVLRTPNGTEIKPMCCGLRDIVIQRAGTSANGLVAYEVPRPEQGNYTITVDYVGCCGTHKGQVSFTVPSF